MNINQMRFLRFFIAQAPTGWVALFLYGQFPRKFIFKRPL